MIHVLQVVAYDETTRRSGCITIMYISSVCTFVFYNCLCCVVEASSVVVRFGEHRPLITICKRSEDIPGPGAVQDAGWAL
jgi:hypothetical protein